MQFLSCGDYIKSIRKNLYITQKELAMDTLSHNSISSIENGKSELNYRLAYKLSENINKIALTKRINMKLTANDLLESAESKCEKWCIAEMEKLKNLNSITEAMEGYREIARVAEQYKLINYYIDANIILGEKLYALREYVEAYQAFSVCVPYCKEVNDIYNLANTYNYMGMCLYYSDMDESYRHHFKAYEVLNAVANEIKYKELRMKVIYYLALYHIQKSAYSEAEGYLESIRDYKSTDTDLSIKLLILEANLKINTKHYEESINLLQKLLPHKKKKIKAYEYLIYSNLGVCYEKIGNFQEATNYYEKAIRLQLVDCTPDFTKSLMASAKLQMKNDRNEIALRYLEGGFSSAIRFGQSEYIVESYRLYYLIHKQRRNYSECKKMVNELRKYLSESPYIDIKNTLSIMEVDYLLETNNPKGAKEILYDLLIGNDTDKSKAI
jgi:tetratricopeptide (TPR) repeat protein